MINIVRKLRSTLGAFVFAREASALPMAALAALPLFASVGAAIDFGRASSGRLAMQAALDAAALAMAKDAKNVEADQLNTNANNYFRANFTATEVNNVQTTASSSSSSGGYAVTLSAAGSMQTRFMGIMGFSDMKLAVNSSAQYNSDGKGCVLSLDPTAAGATTGQGSTTVTLNGCTLYDNSSDPTAAMVVGGSANITALSVGVVGQISGADHVTTSQGIQTGMGPLLDPYASAYYPPVGSCMQQNYTAKSEVTLTPGVYCGGIGVNAGASVTLAPGLYYLDGGNLSVNGGATLKGSDVTLIFTSKNRNGYANVTINGNANIDLRPPAFGATAGIVIFGDRNMPTGTSFKFNGGSTQYFGGAVYVPKGAIEFAGGGNSGMTCTQLIGDTVTFTGNSNLSLNCSSYGTRPFSAAVIKLTM